MLSERQKQYAATNSVINVTNNEMEGKKSKIDGLKTWEQLGSNNSKEIAQVIMGQKSCLIIILGHGPNCVLVKLH